MRHRDAGLPVDGALATCLLLALAGCGSTGSPSPSAAPRETAPAVMSPSPTAAATPAPAATPTAAPTATPSASPAPTATPTATSTATATPATGFTCNLPIHRNASSSATSHVADVRVGRHADYDRVVFTFSGTAIPEVTMERTSPPILRDPSDQPLRVPGSSFVMIKLVHASGAGYSTEDGNPTYTGPDRFTPRYPRLTSLVMAGDFEGYYTWAAGLTGPDCSRILVLSGPTRLVIDFQAP